MITSITVRKKIVLKRFDVIYLNVHNSTFDIKLYRYSFSFVPVLVAPYIELKNNDFILSKVTH